MIKKLSLNLVLSCVFSFAFFVYATAFSGEPAPALKSDKLTKAPVLKAAISTKKQKSFFVNLANESQWKNVRYNKIPHNEVRFSAEGLEIKVHHSANPLVYKFDGPQKVKSFKVRYDWSGLEGTIDKDKKSGENYDGVKDMTKESKNKLLEDSPLRLGFVMSGEKKLNFVQRQIAAKWVLELFNLAPKGEGLSHIEFINLAWPEQNVPFERIHPKSDLLHEKWVQNIKSGENEFDYSLKTIAKDVHALWVSVDGDDLRLNYTLKIKIIEIFTH